jgi:outer membrane protein assembly factor BamD (BamD/ComL family)
MKKILALSIILVSFLFSGCGPSKSKMTKEISGLEKELYSGITMNFNRQKADSLLTMYEKYVKRYPKDSLAPKYLFQAAGLAMTLNDGKKSMTLFDEFIREFPQNPKAPSCLFFKAYVYENLLTEYDKAKETYLLFIEKYPDNEFVKDAHAALMNIGKSPEQLVREFEERQKAEEARVADSIAASKGKKIKKEK